MQRRAARLMYTYTAMKTQIRPAERPMSYLLLNEHCASMICSFASSVLYDTKYGMQGHMT
eukprot:scaffold6339_cov17-Prasinocladus_malaysianus.AAC.3